MFTAVYQKNYYKILSFLNIHVGRCALEAILLLVLLIGHLYLNSMWFSVAPKYE